jgi:hypothetical protein
LRYECLYDTGITFDHDIFELIAMGIFGLLQMLIETQAQFSGGVPVRIMLQLSVTHDRKKEYRQKGI